MIELIRSGGQNGADVAGLFAGQILGIPTTGCMPKGFLTDTGSRPEYAQKFGVYEHTSSKYPPRTYVNVKESDGTVRFASNFSSAGELCTLKAIEYYKKPYFDVLFDKNIDFDITHSYGYQLCQLYRNELVDFGVWVVKNKIKKLNVAGNRESTCPGINFFTTSFLTYIIKIMKENEEIIDVV